jgi:hypothetical protein
VFDATGVILQPCLCLCRFDSLASQNVRRQADARVPLQPRQLPLQIRPHCSVRRQPDCHGEGFGCLARAAGAGEQMPADSPVGLVAKHPLVAGEWRNVPEGGVRPFDLGPRDWGLRTTTGELLRPSR